MRSARVCIVTAVLATSAVAVTSPAAGAAQRAGAPVQAGATRPDVVYRDLPLPGGRHALVYSDGLAEVFAGDQSRAEFRWVPLLNPTGGTSLAGAGGTELPAKGDLIADLARQASLPYAAHEVVVVYRGALRAGQTFTASAHSLRARSGLVPRYTDSVVLNSTLAALGVDRASQMFTGIPTAQLAGLHATAERAIGHPLADFSRAFVLHLTAASVPAAVARLRANANVAYAAPDWTVSTADTPPLPIPSGAAPAQVAAPAAGLAADVPQNYALTSSAQSLLNRPGVDAVPAYTAVADRYHPLPGEGETITNVSLGTLDDASAAADPGDPCNFWASAYGPTTEVIGNQRYLDWPSMPLIPTYTSDAAGNVNPVGETCGPDDPALTEVGLDFSMMAPLPHNVQRRTARARG